MASSRTWLLFLSGSSHWRLDDLLIVHKNLPRVVSTSIDVISLSNHAPVSWFRWLRTLRLGDWVRPYFKTEETHAELLTALQEYFSLNGASTDNLLVVWEAHKPVNRGTLIQIGARLKRERSRCTDERLCKRCSLKHSHKASLARSTYLELLRARETQRSLLYHKTKQNLALAHHTVYEFSNKPGLVGSTY